jgi:hypothetical protein
MELNLLDIFHVAKVISISASSRTLWKLAIVLNVRIFVILNFTSFIFFCLSADVVLFNVIVPLQPYFPVKIIKHRKQVHLLVREHFSFDSLFKCKAAMVNEVFIDLAMNE